MRKILYLFCFCFILFSCNRDNINSTDSNEVKTVVSKNKLNMKYVTHYANGVKNGTELIYYSYGQIAEIGMYKNGLKHGRFIRFFPELYFKGLSQINRALGLPQISKINYFKDDLPQGRQYVFDEDSERIQAIQEWNKGKLVNLICFTNEGKIIQPQISRVINKAQ